MSMQQYNSAIEDALENFNNKYEIPDEYNTVLLEFLHKAGEKHIRSVEVKSTGEVKNTRKRSGYNLYIKDMFRIAKEDGDERNSQEKMTDFSKRWKGLEKDDKDKYTAEANQQVSTSTTKKSTSRRAMTGYNLFYKENKDQIKKDTKEGEKYMPNVGAAWKALSKEEQMDYNERAKTMPTKSHDPVETEEE